MKSESRMSKVSQLCCRRFRPSDFVIRHSDLRIAVSSIKRPVSGLVRAVWDGSVRESFHAIPFQRRKPHSAMKQKNANKNTVERCHSGMVQLSVMGALRFGKLAANESSLFTAMTSPPV